MTTKAQSDWLSIEERPAPLERAALMDAAQRFEAQIRARNIREYLGSVAVVLIFGWWALEAGDLLERLGALATVAAAVFVSLMLWRSGRAAPPPYAAPSAEFRAFRRDELERQRQLLNGVVGWYLLPFVPGFALIQASRVARDGFGLPDLFAIAIVVAVFGVIWHLNRAGARQLGRLMSELD